MIIIIDYQHQLHQCNYSITTAGIGHQARTANNCGCNTLTTANADIKITTYPDFPLVTSSTHDGRRKLLTHFKDSSSMFHFLKLYVCRRYKQ